MFLAMDRFPPERVAAVDDRGASITYGELCAFMASEPVVETDATPNTDAPRA